MFKNFENFIYSSEENFPKNECTVPYKEENQKRICCWLY